MADSGDYVRPRISLLPDLEIDLENLRATLPQTLDILSKNTSNDQWTILVTFMGFLERMVSSCAIFPGSCFQRQTTVIDMLEIALWNWLPNDQNTKTKGFTRETRKELENFLKLLNRKLRWSLFTSSTRDFLLDAVFFSNRVVQDKCLELLFQHFVKNDEGEPLNIDRLRTEAISLCNAPQSGKFQSGARVLCFVLKSSQSTYYEAYTTKTAIVLKHMADSLLVADNNVLDASKNSTGLGFLMTLASLNAIVEGEEIFRYSRQIYDLILRVTTNMLMLMGCKADDTTRAAPSFEELGVSIMATVRQSVSEDAELDDCPCLPPDYQHVLSWAWNGLKISADILVMLTRVLREKSCFKMLKDIGELLLRILALTRHRGTIESVADSFEVYCRLLTQSEDKEIQEYPEKFVDEIFRCMTESYSVTRRSAGLPLILNAVMASQARRHNSSCFNRTVNKLLTISSEYANFSSDSQCTDSASVHGFNLLRGMVREASIAESVSAYHSRILAITVKGFSSHSWAVRNSCLQLFSTLSLRMVGVNRPVMLITEFFTLYPHLEQLLCDTINGVTADSSLFEQQSIIPLLTLISQLSPDPSTNAFGSSRRVVMHLLPHLHELLKSPIFVLRQVTAKAILALTPIEKLPSVFDKAMDLSLTLKNSNLLHGYALLFQQIIAEGLVFSKKDIDRHTITITTNVKRCASVGNWFLASYFGNLFNLLCDRGQISSLELDAKQWISWIRASSNHRMQARFIYEAGRIVLRSGCLSDQLIREVNMDDILEAFLQFNEISFDNNFIEIILTDAERKLNQRSSCLIYLQVLQKIVEKKFSVLSTVQRDKILSIFTKDISYGQESLFVFMEIVTHIISTVSHEESKLLIDPWMRKLTKLSDIHSEELQRQCAGRCLRQYFEKCRRIKVLSESHHGFECFLTVVTNILLDESSDIRRIGCEICARLTPNSFEESHIICFTNCFERIYRVLGSDDDPETFLSAIVRQWNQLLSYLSDKLKEINTAREKKVLYEPDDANVYREYRFVGEALFSLSHRHMEMFEERRPQWKQQIEELLRRSELLRDTTADVSDRDGVKYAVKCNYEMLSFLLDT